MHRMILFKYKFNVENYKKCISCELHRHKVSIGCFIHIYLLYEWYTLCIYGYMMINVHLYLCIFVLFHTHEHKKYNIKHKSWNNLYIFFSCRREIETLRWAWYGRMNWEQNKNGYKIALDILHVWKWLHDCKFKFFHICLSCA